MDWLWKVPTPEEKRENSKNSSRISEASSANGKKRRCEELQRHQKFWHSSRQGKSIMGPKVHQMSWTYPPRQQKSVKDHKIHQRFWTRFPRNWRTCKNPNSHRKSFRYQNPSSVIGFPNKRQMATNKSRGRSHQRMKKKTKRRWSTNNVPHQVKKKIRRFTSLRRGWKERHKTKMKKSFRSYAMEEWKKPGIQSHELLGRVRKKVNSSRYIFHGHKGESPKESASQSFSTIAIISVPVLSSFGSS